MSAILGVFHLDGRPVSGDCAPPMLARMRRRGSDVRALHVEGEALLGVSRYAWECVPGLAGRAEVARRGPLMAVSDASLYYVDDLRRRLGNSVEGAMTPAQLILAAYEKWGAGCVEYLEGDYSCIVWDSVARRGWCARDWTGSRPLFYAHRGDTLVIASTIGGVLAHEVVRDTLNLAAIAIDASALLFSASEQTCYNDVVTVPAGGGLTFTRSPHSVGRTLVRIPDALPSSSSSSAADAEEQFRALLGEAVIQRCSCVGPTSMWLSGGRDSTAVFAAGEDAFRRRGINGELLPISLRLAKDDPLNEDHFIEASASRWKRSISWIDVSTLGSVVPSQGWQERDEPYRPLYEDLHRRLASTSRERGAVVALSGHGGDFLFQVSPVMLADLLWQARLGALLREWRALRVERGRVRTFVHWSVVPRLPQSLHRSIAAIRGRHLRGYFEREVPTWIHPDFVKRHELARRAEAGTPRTLHGSRAAYELHWFLTNPFFSRTAACFSEFALHEGLEVRTPLLDSRFVAFAAARPVEERRLQGETKLLVRRAMRGLLPESVLAPRTFKTGTLASYLGHSFSQLATSLSDAFRAPLLGELGVLDVPKLSVVVDRCLNGRASWSIVEQLLATLQAELWLQSKFDTPNSARARLRATEPSTAGDR